MGKLPAGLPLQGQGARNNPSTLPNYHARRIESLSLHKPPVSGCAFKAPCLSVFPWTHPTQPLLLRLPPGLHPCPISKAWLHAYISSLTQALASPAAAHPNEPAGALGHWGKATSRTHTTHPPCRADAATAQPCCCLTGDRLWKLGSSATMVRGWVLSWPQAIQHRLYCLAGPLALIPTTPGRVSATARVQAIDESSSNTFGETLWQLSLASGNNSHVSLTWSDRKWDRKLQNLPAEKPCALHKAAVMPVHIAMRPASRATDQLHN